MYSGQNKTLTYSFVSLITKYPEESPIPWFLQVHKAGLKLCIWKPVTQKNLGIACFSASASCKL